MFKNKNLSEFLFQNKTKKQFLIKKIYIRYFAKILHTRFGFTLCTNLRITKVYQFRGNTNYASISLFTSI